MALTSQIKCFQKLKSLESFKSTWTFDFKVPLHSPPKKEKLADLELSSQIESVNLKVYHLPYI